MGADPRDPETRSQASGPGGVALRLGYQGGAAAPHFSGVVSPPCFFGVSSPCFFGVFSPCFLGVFSPCFGGSSLPVVWGSSLPVSLGSSLPVSLGSSLLAATPKPLLHPRVTPQPGPPAPQQGLRLKDCGAGGGATYANRSSSIKTDYSKFRIRP